ncbi:MAG TPA: hypothetical protein VFN46_01470 [Acetobacteraceae bacterium]|nr:hypothetical protein [Acetobacteraceae bacterium]
MGQAEERGVALARPDRDINHVIAYGQSLSNGYEGWPALSQEQPCDSLMLGEAVRPLRDDSVEWRPVGAAAFRPLRAVVQDYGSGAPLDAAAVAALPPGSISMGETVLEGAVNFWRRRQIEGGALPGRQRLLASSCGVGGRTLEALSKGASPELFRRLRDCVRLARATAAAEGASYGIAAVLFLQGESNSWGLDGGTADRAAYKALLHMFRRDALADLATGIAGQAAAPAMFLYQTGGTYASESLSIAQAQLDFTLETQDCFLVAPHYAVTGKGGHLDANGYRWLGQQFGKVMHRVLTLGEDWRPLHPLRAEMKGQEVRVTFHVPVPPLSWGRPICGYGFADPQAGGFSVLDEAGSVPVTKVALDGPDRVRIVLGRETAGAVTLRYADQAHGGRGALHDSDATVAPDRYVFDPATGHYPEADIPELAGRPYPLMNWCVAFAIPVMPPALPPRPALPAWNVLMQEAPPPAPAPRRAGWLARLLGRR